MGYKITIDGPSGAGKGCLADAISKKLGILNVDTGAMYRAFGLYCANNGVDLDNPQKIIDALTHVNIELVYNDTVLKVLLNGHDVSGRIRNEQVAMFATKVSSVPEVRQYISKIQRHMADENNIVMEGRDIGSVIFPEAELKIYLTADVDVRARRRYNDLIKKNSNVTFEEVLEDIKRRDEKDLTKKISPLIKTKDMIEIDSTKLSKDQVVEKVLELVKEKGLVLN